MGSVTVELEVEMTTKLGYIFIKKDKTGSIMVADQKGKILCKKDIPPAGLFKTKVNVADLEIEANKIFTTNDAKQSPWVSKIHIGSYKKLDEERRHIGHTSDFGGEENEIVFENQTKENNDDKL